MLNLFIDFLFQLLFTVGFIVIFGFIIAQCNKKFYSNFGARAQTVCYITGFIGTPVHELSHALFCVIFGHKITEIKLFQINSADGTLGYVNHSYNRKNIYQRIGNFFIGVAPIIVITAVLFLCAWLLIPDFTAEVFTAATSGETAILPLLQEIWQIIIVFFSCAASWQWWVFLLIGLFLSLHMTLSAADIKGALSGLLTLIIILFLVDLILYFIGGNYLYSFTRTLMGAGCGALCFFIIALIISLLSVAVSYLFRLLFSRR